jgi:hypothetical protein
MATRLAHMLSRYSSRPSFSRQMEAEGGVPLSPYHDLPKTVFDEFHRLLPCFGYCNVLDVAIAARVSKLWHRQAKQFLVDRRFLRSCAWVGFGRLSVVMSGTTLRAYVWQLATRAKHKKQALEQKRGTGLYKLLVSKQAIQSEEIDRDTTRTHLHAEAFADDDLGNAVLGNLLKAYSVLDPEVGYCQGMNFIVGFMLTQMPEEDAFFLLYALLSEPRFGLRHFFIKDIPGLIMCKEQFEQLLTWFLPVVAVHFRRIEVVSSMYAEWFMTLFTCKCFPRDLSARVWDLLFVDGVRVLHQVALAVLHAHQDILVTLDFASCIIYLKTLPDAERLDPDKIIASAREFVVTDMQLEWLEHHIHRRPASISTEPLLRLATRFV